MRRFPAAVMIACLVAAGPAGAEEARAPEASAKSVKLPANEFHEECMELAVGQRLGYSFRSTAPLDFNVHYHRAGKVYYPIRKRGVSALGGSYRPTRSDGYCLMWKNAGRKPAELKYRFGTAVYDK